MNQKEGTKSQEEIFKTLICIFSNIVFSVDFGAMKFTVDYGANHIEMSISKDHTVHFSTTLTLENTTNQERLVQNDYLEEK